MLITVLVVGGVLALSIGLGLAIGHALSRNIKTIPPYVSSLPPSSAYITPSYRTTFSSYPSSNVNDSDKDLYY